MTNPFAAFDERVKRRLLEMSEGAHQACRAIEFKMSAAGRAGSGAHLRALLDEMKTQMDRAIDWALLEARWLPSHSHISPEHVIPILHQQLLGFLDAMFSAIRWPRVSPSADELIGTEKAKLRETLQAELSDYRAGIWQPRAAAEASIITNNSNIIFQGHNEGIIQQAGPGSSQHANVSNVEAVFTEFLNQLDAAAISEELKNEMRAEVETLRLQSKRSTPNRSVMQAAGSGLYNLAIGIAGGLLTPHVQTLLRALGIPT